MQQRTIETRATILEAALIEFAERGFDGASTTRISRRAGVDQPLISYHFGLKEELWKAVASHFFQMLTDYWDQAIPAESSLPPALRVKLEFQLLFRFMLEHPRWYHFILRETAPASPRLQWLADNYIAPLRGRIIDQIRDAQADAQLPQTDPFLLYYVVMGATTVLTALAGEMRALPGIDPDDAGVADAVWSLIELSLLTRPA